MMNFNMELYVTLAMWALPVGISILLAILVITDIVEGRKSKKQMVRFKELYQACINKHGIEFAKKLYDACLEPWIGMDNVIKVFEHHCNANN